MPFILLISILFRFLLLGDYQLVKAVDTEGNMHSTDPMGNVYLVKNNTLKKFSNKHVQAAYYTNTFFGDYSFD